MRYAAALLGPGSEVAGFDTQRSTDHDWGPRLQVFLSDDSASSAAAVTPPLDTRTSRFHDRPYQVIGAGRFAAALQAAITDPQLSRLPLIGAIDQFTDSTDAAGDLRFTRACAAAAIAWQGSAALSSGGQQAAGQDQGE